MEAFRVQPLNAIGALQYRGNLAMILASSETADGLGNDKFAPELATSTEEPVRQDVSQQVALRLCFDIFLYLFFLRGRDVPDGRGVQSSFNADE
ncbi:hypothetical protein NDU88_000524 [Pleurodeles waltl]|uniref:Uncharacterized protein n=1 Tax=Pleurodeles waltl TaxID=8319 RepID=A0AAV7P144_PLEWA|nr:hypothetical protein NDU88_000524 [Pleurodeles waltl]